MNPIVVSIERPARIAARERGAEVGRDQPQLLERSAEKLAGTPRGVGVREPVKAEPTQAPALDPGTWQRIDTGFGGQGGVKGRVEAGHVGRRRP